MIHQIDSKNKWLHFFAIFAGKFELVFVSVTGKRFFLVVSFQNQQEKHRVFSKTVLGIFKTALRLRDRYAFV